MSVHACVHVVCLCMPLWVLHNINGADLCVAVLPKALAYTLTCIHANGVIRRGVEKNSRHRAAALFSQVTPGRGGGYKNFFLTHLPKNFL